MNSRRIFIGMYVLALALITWDEIREQKRSPVPSRYVSVSVVFGLLGVVSAVGGDPLAAAFGAGIVLMLAYSLSKDTGAGTQKELAPNPNAQGEAQPSFERQE